MCAQCFPVAYLDRDAEVDECSVDSENSRVFVQWPEFPALEGQVGVSVLHQNKSLEGAHLEGDLGLFLLVRDIRDAIHPPLFTWARDPTV